MVLLALSMDANGRCGADDELGLQLRFGGVRVVSQVYLSGYSDKFGIRLSCVKGG